MNLEKKIIGLLKARIQVSRYKRLSSVGSKLNYKACNRSTLEYNCAIKNNDHISPSYLVYLLKLRRGSSESVLLVLTLSFSNFAGVFVVIGYELHDEY